MEHFELGNTGIDSTIRTENDRVPARFGHLNKIVDVVTALQETPPGSGVQSVTGTAVNNTDPLNPVINSVTGDYLPLAGGTMDTSATIAFVNGSQLQQGTTDAGLGGNGGVALKCSIQYELKWDAGRLFVMEQNGFTIRESLYNFTTVPTASDDVLKGYVLGSRWTLDNGITYVCTDNADKDAKWQLEVNSASGVHSPAITINSGANVTKLSNGFYSVVNGLVTVVYNLSVNYSEYNQTSFSVDLPVPPANNFNSEYDASVSFTVHGVDYNLVLTNSGSSDVGSKLVNLGFSIDVSIFTSIQYTVTITYFI